MDYDRDSTRLPYRGWEIRSHLTHISFDGTVAAGAMIYFEEACKCHLVSCKQFVDGFDAIHAIEAKASLWVDDRELNPRSEHVEPLLS